VGCGVEVWVSDTSHSVWSAPEVMAEQRPPQSHVPLRCVFAKLCNARPFVDDIWMGFGAGGEVRKRWAPHLTVDSLRLVSVVSAQCGFAGKS